MVKLRDLVLEVIEELKRINADERFFSNNNDFPGLIAAGDYGSLLINSNIQRNIEIIAQELKRNDRLALKQFTDSEWRAIVRRAFGPVLASIDLDDDQSVKTILERVRVEIEAAKEEFGPRRYALGCTLFRNPDIEPISMGPVQIETRSVWLSRLLLEGSIDATLAGRIDSVWAARRKPNGRLEFIAGWMLKLFESSVDAALARIDRVWEIGHKAKARKKFIARTRERDILDAVGSCPFVCSVSCDGLGEEAGKQRIITAARMALAIVSLIWQKPSAVLEGFRLEVDDRVRAVKVLTFVPGKVTLAGSKLVGLPHGYTFEPGEWNSIAIKSADLFLAAGEVFSFFVDTKTNVARPKLMNTLLQAVLWFSEGCKDRVDAMAIVKFSSSMDALAVGEKSPGIRKLITARLKIADGDLINKYIGLTMKETVERIYNHGRSRTVHGTSDDMLHDLTQLRSLAESLARLCLYSSLTWAVKNGTIDDPAKLKL